MNTASVHCSHDTISRIKARRRWSRTLEYEIKRSGTHECVAALYIIYSTNGYGGTKDDFVMRGALMIAVASLVSVRRVSTLSKVLSHNAIVWFERWDMTRSLKQSRDMCIDAVRLVSSARARFFEPFLDHPPLATLCDPRATSRAFCARLTDSYLPSMS